jgi:predicted acyltransferase
MGTNQRYLALDVLRGMTIVFMILVNNPGSWQYVYPPLLHAEWHGCTPTDLVFPFFLFVVGVSMFFSFSKNNSGLNKDSLLKVLRRTLLIFLIGLFINSFPQWRLDISQLRIMGVLQRIALAYGIAAIIVLAFRQKWIPYATAILLVGYWALLYFTGGDDPYSLTGNAVLKVDLALLGESHLYRGFREAGTPIAFDPEGLLSTIPSVATVLLGFLAGILIKNVEKSRVPMELILAGIAFTIAGYIWGFFFPINKPLWTSSYVLYTAGMAGILFGILIYIIDIRENKAWSKFFVVFGLNPLFIFALSGIWAKALWMLIRFETAEGRLITGSGWLYNNIFVPLAGNLNGSLLYALAHIVLFWIIGVILYRQNVIIKV